MKKNILVLVVSIFISGLSFGYNDQSILYSYSEQNFTDQYVGTDYRKITRWEMKLANDCLLSSEYYLFKHNHKLEHDLRYIFLNSQTKLIISGPTSNLVTVSGGNIFGFDTLNPTDQGFNPNELSLEYYESLYSKKDYDQLKETIHDCQNNVPYNIAVIRKIQSLSDPYVDESVQRIVGVGYTWDDGKSFGWTLISLSNENKFHLKVADQKAFDQLKVLTAQNKLIVIIDETKCEKDKKDNVPLCPYTLW